MIKLIRTRKRTRKGSSVVYSGPKNLLGKGSLQGLARSLRKGLPKK